VKTFEAPACVIVKHANPCGVAVGATLAEAYQKAWQTDPTSAFGGIIAFNRPLDEATARQIGDNKQFVEVMIAPGSRRRRGRCSRPSRTCAARGAAGRWCQRSGLQARGRRPAAAVARHQERRAHRVARGDEAAPTQRRWTT
jgi:hypothetical protein